MGSHAVDIKNRATCRDAPPPAATTTTTTTAILLRPVFFANGAGMKQQRAKNDRPARGMATVKRPPRILGRRPSLYPRRPAAATTTITIGVERNQRAGEDHIIRGVLLVIDDYSESSSTSTIRARDNKQEQEGDFYSRCARIFAPSSPSLTTAAGTANPKTPARSPTMKTWARMTTRASSGPRPSRADDDGTLAGLANRSCLALSMLNATAALAPQPHSAARGWNPMGDGGLPSTSSSARNASTAERAVCSSTPPGTGSSCAVRLRPKPTVGTSVPHVPHYER